MAATKYTRITFQSSPALKRRLEQCAKRENRTTSNMIVTLLTEALDRKRVADTPENPERE